MIRRLDPEFLQTWLQAAGVAERLRLAWERLPERPEPLEQWDWWLQLQDTLLRSRLPEEQEESLLQAIRELGSGSLRVQGVPPEGRRVGLQDDFPGLRGTAAVLEAVRLAWAAVLSAIGRIGERLPAGAQVTVRREEAVRDSVGRDSPAALEGGPDRCLLRLAELHHRLLQPDTLRPLQSLLDLRPWVQQPWAAPDADQQTRFLRAAEAAGRRDAAELLRRGREAWAAWVASPAPGAGPSIITGPCRQLAGAPGAPGLASGPARLQYSGRILVCRHLLPSRSTDALAAAGLVTEQGGSLSYGAVLAARAGIPCVCGVRGALARIREGDVLQLDGGLGIVTVQPGRGSR